MGMSRPITSPGVGASRACGLRRRRRLLPHAVPLPLRLLPPLRPRPAQQRRRGRGGSGGRGKKAREVGGAEGRKCEKNTKGPARFDGY